MHKFKTQGKQADISSVIMYNYIDHCEATLITLLTLVASKSKAKPSTIVV